MKKQWKENNICIYGLGAYGLRIYFFLKECNLQIACFGDRDEKKCGYALEGIKCRKYEEIIEYDKAKWTIIVAVENPEKLVKHFKKLGFQHVLNFNEVMEMFSEHYMLSEEKGYMLINDMETVRRYKENLEYVLTYGVQIEKLDNTDMQIILEDCIKRKKDRDKYCESSRSK